MAWAWRRRAAQPWRRSELLMFFAICNIAALLAVATLNGWALTSWTGEMVLLRGAETCGWWDAVQTNDSESWLIQRTVLREAQQHADDCYSTDATYASTNSDCKSVFVSPSIGFEIEENMPCPFPNSTFCRSSSEAAIRITSEVINSNKHLGLNAKAEDQIDFRQYMTCSPLPDTVDTAFADDFEQTVFNPSMREMAITERYFRYSNN